MFKCNSKFILLFFTAMITSCLPPKSFYKMEGSINLRNKINEIIEKSEIDLNMSIQIISLKDDKVIYDYNSQKLLMPASTNKLYTCAAAFHFLKKHHQFSPKRRRRPGFIHKRIRFSCFRSIKKI